MTPPILWSFRRCPYAMRARMALSVAGITCELREILLSRKPEAFLAASTKGTVPVLVLPDGGVLDESLDVMDWALAQNDPQDWLGADQAESRALISENDGTFKHHLDRYKYPGRYDGVDSDAHFAAAIELLKDWDARLADQTGLIDDQDRLADIALFPFVRQFVAVDRPRVEEAGIARLLAWLDRHLTSSRFAKVMKKYPLWDGGQGPLVFSAETDNNAPLAATASDVGV